MSADPIDGLRIASPCSVAWESMDGDERMRHCAVCSLNVYNFAGMTREEVRALLARNEGRVCAKLYRRADGTVLTRDCPTGLRGLRRRASRAAVAAVAALLSLPAFALSGKKPEVSAMGAVVNITLGHVTTQHAAVFNGIVVMDDGPIPGVTITLREETSARTLTTVTDAKGFFTFGSLPDGMYRAELTLPGLQPASISHLDLKANVVTHANVTLHAIEEMGILLIPDEPVRHDPLSMTFTQSFIDKLPF